MITGTSIADLNKKELGAFINGLIKLYKNPTGSGFFNLLADNGSGSIGVILSKGRKIVESDANDKR